MGPEMQSVSAMTNALKELGHTGQTFLGLPKWGSLHRKDCGEILCLHHELKRDRQAHWRSPALCFFGAAVSACIDNPPAGHVSRGVRRQNFFEDRIAHEQSGGALV